MDFLTEAAGKNLHLEHLEDEILNFGIAGGRSAINFLQALRDMFAGKTGSGMNVTVKWDGAPAVFAGPHPETGKFFVATKSLFRKLCHSSGMGRTSYLWLMINWELQPTLMTLRKMLSCCFKVNFGGCITWFAVELLEDMK